MGFVEYGKSLQFLTEFLTKANEEEIEIAEEIVRGQDQFAVYTNLSRKIQGTTFFTERPQESNDKFRRHGLAWMTALARVELGAMLAGFTSHPKPFQFVKPIDYDAASFQKLLVDGMRMHYWTLKRDPAIKAYHSSGLPEQHIITYGRRASVARHFLQAVRDLTKNDLMAIQLAELKAQEIEINRLQLAFVYCLSLKSASRKSESVSSKLSGCTTLLAAARRELGDVEGRASAVSIDSPRLPQILRQIEPTLVTIPCQ